MSNSIKSILALSLVALTTACAQPAEEEFIVVEPEPISVEPVSSGKYGGKY